MRNVIYSAAFFFYSIFMISHVTKKNWYLDFLDSLYTGLSSQVELISYVIAFLFLGLFAIVSGMLMLFGNPEERAFSEKIERFRAEQKKVGQ